MDAKSKQWHHTLGSLGVIQTFANFLYQWHGWHVSFTEFDSSVFFKNGLFSKMSLTFFWLNRNVWYASLYLARDARCQALKAAKAGAVSASRGTAVIWLWIYRLPNEGCLYINHHLYIKQETPRKCLRSKAVIPNESTEIRFKGRLINLTLFWFVQDWIILHVHSSCSLLCVVQ